MSWTDGYVADTAYTNHFYAELAPTHLDFVALNAGFAPPDHDDGRFRYCELGCGNGASTNLLAVSNPDAAFVGIDFMPVHVASARQAAREAGIRNAHFLEMSFAQASHESFEPFDYIVAHGVFSWITRENRGELVEFIRRFLRPGGVAYVSYNTYPGWSAIAPVQRVVSEYAETIRGASTQRVTAGFAFAARLLKEEAAALAHSPAAKGQIEKASTMPANYLAQEYLNACWYPMYVTDAMRELSVAKLEYLASATPAENDLRFLVSDVLANTIREQPTEELRQLIKDIATNARFRRDVYGRGARRLSPNARAQRIAGRHVALTRNPEAITFHAEHLGRKIAFDSPYARAAVAALAERPLSLGELAALLQKAGAGDGLKAACDVSQVLMIANAAIAVHPTGIKVTQTNRALAAHVLEEGASDALATSFGTAVRVNSTELAFISVGASSDSAAVLAEKVQRLAQEKRLAFAKKGVPLSEASEVRAFLEEEAASYIRNRRQALLNLGVQALGGL